MKKSKVNLLILSARSDLKKWLSYAKVSSLKEFEEKKEYIKNHYEHHYTDVIKHLKYIKKLEDLYAKL